MLRPFQIAKLHNDPLKAETKTSNDNRLDHIIEFGQMAFDLAGS